MHRAQLCSEKKFSYSVCFGWSKLTNFPPSSLLMTWNLTQSTAQISSLQTLLGVITNRECILTCEMYRSYCRDLWHCKKHLKCQNMFNFNFYLCLTYFSRSLEGEKKVIMLLQCGLVYPMPHKGAWYWSQCTWPWWLCVSVGFPSKAQWYPQWEESIS